MIRKYVWITLISNRFVSNKQSFQIAFLLIFKWLLSLKSQSINFTVKFLDK